MAKTINAVFTSGVFTRTAKVFQWDNGDKLSFVNVDLPNNYQVHFANSLTGESKSVLGDSTGVEIPPEYFVPGSEIYAWVWVSTENGGYTKYQVTIPVYRRAQPQNVTPTPAQQTIIDQAIEALNQALETQITPEEKAKLAGIEAGAQVNDIEHIYATDPSTEEVVELPIGGLFTPAKSVLIPDYLEVKTLEFTIDSNGDVTSGPIWNDIDAAFSAGKKIVLANVTDGTGNIYTLPFTKYFDAPNVPSSYTFAGCGEDGKIRTIQSADYANGWWYTEIDFDGLIVGEIDAVFDNTGNRVDLLTTDKSSLVAAINEVNAKAGGTFWATYNTTPFADIVAAHNAGKAVFVKESGVIYSLDYVAAHYVTFSLFSVSSLAGQQGSFNEAYCYGIKVTDWDVWSTYDDELALKSDIGSRADLTTTAKNNLVAAINEVNANAGGGGVEDFAVTLDLNTYTVTPGTGTTISAIRAAIADGKIVRLIANSSYVFDMVSEDGLNLYFSCPMTDGISQIRAYQNFNHTDAWAFSGSVIPTKTSDLQNDSGFLTSYTETDPTVPSWAKASSKPSYTKSEVGLGNVDNVQQYSASNPPPYPVTSVNGNTGAVTISVPTKTSDLTNDSGFGTYSKPSGGIPKTDLASSVQTSLGKADTALQSHQDISGKQNNVTLDANGILIFS